MTNSRTTARLERTAEAATAHARTFTGRLGPTSRPAAMALGFEALSSTPEHVEWRRLAAARLEAERTQEAHASTREEAEALDAEARARAVTADPSAPLPAPEHVPAHEATSLELARRVEALGRVEVTSFLDFLAAVRDRSEDLKREHLAAAEAGRTRLDALLDQAEEEVRAIDAAEAAVASVRRVVVGSHDERKLGLTTAPGSVEVDLLPPRRLGNVGLFAPATLLGYLRAYRAASPEPEPTPDPFELVIEPNDRPDVSGPRRRAARAGIRRASTEADAA